MKRLSRVIAPVVTTAVLLTGAACEASPQEQARATIDRNLHATSATIARGLLARIATHNAEGVPNSIGSHLEVTGDTLNPKYSDRRLIIGNGALMLSGVPAQSITVELGTTDGKPDSDKVTLVAITQTACANDLNPPSCNNQLVATIAETGDGWVAQESTYRVPHSMDNQHVTSTIGKTDVGLAQRLAGDINAKTLALLKLP